MGSFAWADMTFDVYFAAEAYETEPLNHNLCVRYGNEPSEYISFCLGPNLIKQALNLKLSKPLELALALVQANWKPVPVPKTSQQLAFKFNNPT